MPTYGGDSNEFPVVKYDGHATYAPTSNEVTVATARGRVPTSEGSGAAGAALAALSGFANVPALALCGASALSNWVNKWNRDAGYSQSSFLIGGVMAADGFLSNVSTGLYHAMTGGGCSGPAAVPAPMGTGGAGCSCDSIQGMIDGLGSDVHAWIDGIPAGVDNSGAIASVGVAVGDVLAYLTEYGQRMVFPFRANPVFLASLGNPIKAGTGPTGDPGNDAEPAELIACTFDTRITGEDTYTWLHRMCPSASISKQSSLGGTSSPGIGTAVVWALAFDTEPFWRKFYYVWDAWGAALGLEKSSGVHSSNPLFVLEGSLSSAERTALDAVSVHGLESLPLEDMVFGLNAALPGWDFVASDDGQFPRGTIPSSGSRVWFNLLPCGVDRANNYAYVPTSGEPERSVQRDLVDLMSLVPFTPGTRDRP